MTVGQPNYGNRPIEDGLISLIVFWSYHLRFKTAGAWHHYFAAEGKASDFFVRRFFFAIFALWLVGFAALAHFAPPHVLAACLSVGAISLPLSVVLTVLTRPVALRVERSLPKTSLKKLKIQSFLFVGLLLATTGLLWAANRALDFAPAPRAVFPLVGRQEVQTHQGVKTYVVINLPSPHPFGFEGSDRVAVPVTAADYAASSADSMQVVLTLHSGFLGLPWYESRTNVINGRTASGRSHVDFAQHYENKGNSVSQALP